MRPTQHTQLNMVIGYPLAHSHSPTLHNAIYQALGLDAVLLACPHQDLNALMQTIQTLSVALTAVTMPFKEQVVAYCDHQSDEVQALKAANTIIQRQGKLWGYNTDVDGIAFALQNIVLKDKKVLILGAGGAARAAGYVLQKNHAELYWLNRTPDKAQALAHAWGGHVLDHQAIAPRLFDIIINTTPIGQFPEIAQSPLPDYLFQAHQVVFDMVYNPRHTRLLQQAQQQGATLITGLEMFIGQGLRQIELWQQQPLENPAMIEKIKQQLLRRHP